MNNPMLPKPYRILAIVPETDLEITYTIECGLVPQHGQFVEVSLPGVGEAPISVSGTGDGWIELTIRTAGKLTRAIAALSVGDVLHIRGPYGHPFPEEMLRNEFVVVAAGGCALAPLRTLIRSRLENPECAEKTRLLFGFKNPDAVMYKTEINDWKKMVPCVVTVDDEACVWGGKKGVITRHVPGIDIPNASQAFGVIVGPPIMMKFTAIEFTKRGIAPDRIWVSFERRMACGLGKCGHCKIDDTYVCVDGPVLRYDKALNLFD